MTNQNYSKEDLSPVKKETLLAALLEELVFELDVANVLPFAIEEYLHKIQFTGGDLKAKEDGEKGSVPNDFISRLDACIKRLKWINSKTTQSVQKLSNLI